VQDGQDFNSVSGRLEDKPTSFLGEEIQEIWLLINVELQFLGLASVAPAGLTRILRATHGLRRGLHILPRFALPDVSRRAVDVFG
jgi:hypothetical protein